MAGRYVGRLPRKCDQKISVPPCFVAICSQKQPFCGTLGVWRSCAQHAGVVRALVRANHDRLQWVLDVLDPKTRYVARHECRSGDVPRCRCDCLCVGRPSFASGQVRCSGNAGARQPSRSVVGGGRSTGPTDDRAPAYFDDGAPAAPVARSDRRAGRRPATPADRRCSDGIYGSPLRRIDVRCARDLRVGGGGEC